MKIALLSGAYKNAGDYLIERRCYNLLRKHTNADISTYLRSEFIEKIDELNDYDWLVFSGGPIYQPFIEKILPNVNTISGITSKIAIIGGGWYGVGNAEFWPYKYKLSDFSKNFLSHIDTNGGILGCRDIPTYQVLKNEGLNNVYLTGCPALFSEESERKIFSEKIKRIAISDPAIVENMQFIPALINMLRERYPNADIQFIFHRGICKNRQVEEVVKYLNNNNIQFTDISGTFDGLNVYNSFDLHIGFRVHAHIYNLSIRNKSILLEEDGRGFGCNSLLGLPSIAAYNYHSQSDLKIERILYKNKSRNLNLISEVQTYLDVLHNANYIQIKNSYKVIDAYYDRMAEMISLIK